MTENMLLLGCKATIRLDTSLSTCLYNNTGMKSLAKCTDGFNARNEERERLGFSDTFRVPFLVNTASSKYSQPLNYTVGGN